MHKIKCLFLSCALIFAACATPIHGFDLAGVGVADLCMPMGSRFGVGVPGYTAEFGIGFGGLAGFELNSLLTLETGVLYVPRTYGTSLVNTTFTMLEFPLLARFSALPLLSLAAGGYVAYGIGNFTESTVGSSYAIQENYLLNGFNRLDVGLLASAALALPIGPLLDILIDLRYYFGLTNALANSVTAGFYFRDFQLLAGLKITL